MPSEYSEVLRIELVADGEQEGAWGDTTNRNLEKVVTQAIAGVAVVPLFDAPYSLSVAYGDEDEARCAAVFVTGLLTASRKVTVPSVTKTYLLRNATTGGFAVTFGTSSGAAVSVPAGQWKLVVIDGLDAHDVFLGILGGVIPALSVTALTAATLNGGTPWTTANDGPGGGLDADTVDGAHLAQILAYVDATAAAILATVAGGGAGYLPVGGSPGDLVVRTSIGYELKSKAQVLLDAGRAAILAGIDYVTDYVAGHIPAPVNGVITVPLPFAVIAQVSASGAMGTGPGTVVPAVSGTNLTVTVAGADETSANATYKVSFTRDAA